MIIVHIAPSAPYNEGWSYQENLLPKYQARLGHDVTLIITNKMHYDGKIVFTPCCDKVMSDGVRLIRLSSDSPLPFRISKAFGGKMKVYNLLKELHPDYVFFHGLVSFTILQVVRYKKRINPACIIVQDNHQDYNIGMSSFGMKNRIIRWFFRCLVRQTINNVERVYGVTPWRMEYANDFFKVPKSKLDLLIMGADDEGMDMLHREEIRSEIRSSYGLSDDTFLVVSGGKLEDNKNIDLLMESCGRLDKVHLLIFGSLDNSIKSMFDQLLLNNPNITYIGWIEANQCYRYFYAADLVCFPGRHSVLWEQACASKVPCLIKHWKGMEHVDVGGNTLLLDDVSVSSLRKSIEGLRFTDKYFHMKRVARSHKTDVFLYSEIAKKTISDYYSICANRV